MGRYLSLSLLALANQLLVLLLQFLVARKYGAHGQVDAWIAGAALPALFSTVAGSLGGQLAMPLLIHAREKTGDDGFRQELGSLTSLFLVAGFGAAAMLVLLAPSWIRLTVPGLTETVRTEAVWFLRVSAFGLAPGVLGVLLAQAAQARGNFWLPPVTGVTATLAQLAAFTLAPAGVALHWMMLAQAGTAFIVPPVMAAGIRGLKGLRPGALTGQARMFLRRSSPALLIVAGTRINHVVDNFFASGLPEGHLAVLGYAVRGTSILQVALAAPVISIVFAELSRSASTENWEEFTKTAAAAARRATWISAGFAALVAGLGEKGAKLLLGWDVAETGTLAACFVALSGIVAFSAWGSLLARMAFAARLDWLAVTYLGLLPVAFNVILDWALVDHFGVMGLAAVTSLNAFIGLPLMDWRLRRSGRSAGEFYVPLVRVILSAVMTAFILWNAPLPEAGSSAGLVFQIVILGAAGLAVFGLLAALLGDRSASEILRSLRERPSVAPAGGGMGVA